MLTAALLALLMSAPALHGQRDLRVELEQRVEGRELLIDVYLTRLSADTIWLAASNFSLYLNAAGLSVIDATIDHRLDGRWDNQYDPAGYNDLSLGKRPDFLTLSINCRSLFKSLNPGRGQALHRQRERVGRVRVPISDPCLASDIRWRLEPIAIMNWASEQIQSRAEFAAPASVPLCSTPTRPSITPLTPLAVCQNSPAVLSTSATGSLQWYRNGQPITGATGPQLTVAQSGRYSVLAADCSCRSPLSDSVTVEVTSTEAPEIWYAADGRLHTRSTTEALQWVRDGKPIAGATGTSIPLVEEGTYRVVRTNRCGSFASADFIWLSTRPLSDPFLLADGAPSVVVHPNPYVGFTHLSYTLPREAEVSVELSVGTGAVVKQLFRERQVPGRYQFRFSGRDHGLSPGTYFLTYRADGVIKTFKVIEVK